MEKAFSTSVDPIQVALSQSIGTGQEFVPSELLSVVNADTTTRPALLDLDRSNAQYQAIQRDFAFLDVHLVTQQQPTPEEQERLTGLMRWLRRELVEWRLEADKDCRTLAAIFAITAFCSRYAKFWHDLTNTTSTNPAIVVHLSKQIAHLEAALSPSTLSRTPLFDKEVLNRFLEADRRSNWAAIVSEWPRFGGFLTPNVYLSQSAVYLSRFAWNDLFAAMEKVRQTVPVMLILSSLSVFECLSLAKGSANPYVQFGSVLRLLQQQRRRNESISQAEEDLLTQLLQAIAEDIGQWERWMDALNRNPVRYPQLQRSLGRTLVHAPESALKQYVYAISLSTTGISRIEVAECLRVFRADASLDRRKRLWTLAHDRWLEWRFGENEPNESIMMISFSDLDFAVIGYAVECMSTDELSARCSALANELVVIGENWQTSAVVFIEASSRILSIFQPYAYASKIDGEHWLRTEGKYMFPFDPQIQRYAAMFFQIRYMIPGLNAQPSSGEYTEAH